MNTFKKTVLVFVCFFSTIFVFSDSIKDTLEMRLEITPVFKLSLEMQIDPDAVPYSGTDLVMPSQNSVVAGQNLNGKISLGHLLARKQNDQLLPLISEYKVLMKVHCETNHRRSYVLTQKLDLPLTGVTTQTLFPETAFVCQSNSNKVAGTVLNLKNAAASSQEETPIRPVRPGELQTIYQSGEAGTDSLEAFVNVWYWVSDLQAEKVMPSQQADNYQSTITITMVEL